MESLFMSHSRLFMLIRVQKEKANLCALSLLNSLETRKGRLYQFFAELFGDFGKNAYFCSRDKVLCIKN